MPTYIISAIIIFILTFVVRWFRGRHVKPTVTDGIQKPGGFDRLIIYESYLNFIGSIINISYIFWIRWQPRFSFSSRKNS